MTVTDELQAVNTNPFHTAFEHAGIGMAIVSLEGKFVEVNVILCNILGYSVQELLATTSRALTHSTSIASENLHLQPLLTGKTTSVHYEKCYKHKEGLLVWCSVNVTLVQGSKKEPLYFLYQLQDISESKLTEAQLLNLTRHDPLTGLANRVLLEEQLSHAIHSAQHRGEQVAVLLFDIDRFGHINNTYGHDVGDLLLRAIVDRVQMQIRSKDIMARLGGDEFVIILTELNHISVPVKVCQKIQNALIKPFTINKHEISVTASIGISTYPMDGKNSHWLLKNAEVARSRAKSAGGNGYQAFTTDISIQSQEKIALQIALRNAIIDKEFKIYYQPKYNLRTHAIVSVEALVRWEKTINKFLDAGEFIPVAEENGVIFALGDWILRTACEQVKNWQLENSKLADLKLAINLSTAQLRDPNLVERVKKILNETGLSPHSLELEITEGALFQEIISVTSVLHDLTEMGVNILIDDFGMSYSSFIYLKRFHIDAIKIDRSFIRNIVVNANDMALVAAIIAMAHALNIKIVAEGVETEEQKQILTRCDCDEVQGNSYSEPLPGENLIKLIGNAEINQSLCP